jgi:hypothetical protein
MEFMSAGVRSQLLTRGPQDLRTAFALAIWSVTTLVAAVLISRRIGGAFGAETGAVTPCLAATVAFLFSLAANALRCTANPSATNRKQLVAAAVTLVPPLGIGVALWTSSSALVGGYLTALLVVAALAAIVTRDLSSDAVVGNFALLSPPAGRGLPSQSSVQVAVNVQPSSVLELPMHSDQDTIGPDEVPFPVDEESGEADPSILQWMTRRQLADGREAVEGAVRIFFESGNRFAVAHIAFVPPLSERPNAECQVLVDFEGRARIGVAQAYGLRIEARRSESDLCALSVEVAFSAETRAAQSAAA